MTPGYIATGRDEPFDQRMSMEEFQARQSERIGRRPIELLPKNQVVPFRLDPHVVDEFERCVNKAEDERPIQSFLEGHPEIVACLPTRAGSLMWVIARQRLGSEHITDFIVGDHCSYGYDWYAIELESPRVTILNQDGSPAPNLRKAQLQVRRWRIWMSQNAQYLRNSSIPIWGPDFQGYCIVLGRRAVLRSQQAELYRSLSADGIAIMTYDRLIEKARARTIEHSTPEALK